MENIVRKGEIACYKQFLLFSKRFLPYMALIYHFKRTLKVALQISGQKIYKNTKISLYSQSLLFFIHKTSVVESHPTTNEIRELLRPRSTSDWKHGLFLHEQLTHLHPEHTQAKF